MNCNICLQAYNCFQRRPLAFDCGHSVCEDCAMKMTLVCPFCKKQSSTLKHNDALQQFLMKIPYYYISTIYDHTSQIPLDSFLNVPVANTNINININTNANRDRDRDRDRDGPLTQVINDELNKFLIRNDWGPDDVFFSERISNIINPYGFSPRLGIDLGLKLGLSLGLSVKSILTTLLTLGYGSELPPPDDHIGYVSFECGNILIKCSDFDVANSQHQHLRNVFVKDVKTGDRLEPYRWDENITKFLTEYGVQEDLIKILKLIKRTPQWRVITYYGGESIVFIPSIAHRLIDEWMTECLSDEYHCPKVDRSDYIVTFKLLNPYLTITKEHIVNSIQQLKETIPLSVYMFLHEDVCVAIDVDATMTPGVSQMTKTKLTPGFESAEIIIDILFYKAMSEFHADSQSQIYINRNEHTVTMFLDLYQFKHKEKIADDFISVLKNYGFVKDSGPIEFDKH